MKWLFANQLVAWADSSAELAVANGHVAVVKYLNENRPWRTSRWWYFNGVKKAIAAGHVDVLRNLNDIACRIVVEWIAVAATNERLEVVRQLYEHRAEHNKYLSIRYNDVSGAVNKAAINGHLRVVLFVVSKGGSIRNVNLAKLGSHYCQFATLEWIWKHLEEGGATSVAE